MSFDRVRTCAGPRFLSRVVLAHTRTTAAPSMHRWPLACIVRFAEGTHIDKSGNTGEPTGGGRTRFLTAYCRPRRSKSGLTVRV